MSRTFNKNDLEGIYFDVLTDHIHNAAKEGKLPASHHLNLGEKDLFYISHVVHTYFERQQKYSQESLKHAQSIAFGILSFYKYARTKFDGSLTHLILTQEGFEYFLTNSTIDFTELK